MTTQIPTAAKRYNVGNRGDYTGNIVETQAIDFNNKGYISAAAKPVVLMTETVDPNFETPLVILMDADDVYVVTSEDVFSIDASTADMTIAGITTGTPPSNSFATDSVFFNGLLHVSDPGGVHHLSGGSWSQSLTGLNTAYPHPLCVSEHQQYLAVGNGPSVIVYNTSYASQATLTIPSDHVVTWIRWRANFLWCGTRNIQGGDARVYVWNGSGTAAQAAYPISGDWAFSGCVYPGTLVVVSSTGQVLRFAGDGFVPLRDNYGNEIAFPCYWENMPWGSSAATSNLCGKISSRGMESKGSTIYMSVDSTIEGGAGGTSTYLPNFPSGLWVFDPEVGLYHKAGHEHLQVTPVDVNSVSSNLLTIASAQIFETGDAVHVINRGGLTGVTNLIYYAIKVSSTTLYLAQTPQQALAGEAITIAGTPSTDQLLFNQYESNGAIKVSRAGGLAVIKSLTFPRFIGKEVLWAADVDTPTSTTVGSIMSLGMGRQESSYVTAFIDAESFTDNFQKILAKFPPLNLATDEIIIKYRLGKRWGIPGRMDFNGGMATWVDSTSFTINPTTYDMYSVEEGDEVKFLDQGAAGYTRHVTDITVDSSTQWTITIDEAVPDITASDVSRVLFTNWVKYRVISTADDSQAAATGLKKVLVAKNSKKIQLKIMIKGSHDVFVSPDVEEITVLSGADQKYA